VAWNLLNPSRGNLPATSKLKTNTCDGGYAMPLKRGKSDATVKTNIKKLVHEYENDGTVGTSHPKNKKKAVKQAVAIALKSAGKSRTQRKSAKH
jgi:hypothetical protein